MAKKKEKARKAEKAKDKKKAKNAKRPELKLVAKKAKAMPKPSAKPSSKRGISPGARRDVIGSYRNRSVALKLSTDFIMWFQGKSSFNRVYLEAFQHSW